jgi:mono/diheme cytochrome c family protein
MPSETRNKIGVGLFMFTVAFLAGAIIVVLWSGPESPADPDDPAQVARGKPVYDRYCASCHGAKLEGQPNWQDKPPTGRMPAPPHDASGHTWHHPDAVLFGITQQGLVPGKYAPPGYQSDMPGFGGVLTDEEIWAVLAYIKSSWPPNIRKAQYEITRERTRR